MIVITGANGLVGSAIIERLIAEKTEFVALKRKTSDTGLLKKWNAQIKWTDGDILDVVSLNKAFENATTVIHTAAMVSFHPKEAAVLMRVNVEGTKNVVDACLSTGVTKLIHISSVAALGRQKGVNQIDEQNKWVESALNSSYGRSKYLAELEVYRGLEEGLNASIICPSFILGPGDWNKSSSQIFKYIWQENKFYSEGQFNYVDSRDLADLIFKLLQKNLPGEKFIASGGTVSYKKLFDELAKRFKKKSPFVKVNHRLLTLFAGLEEWRCLLFSIKPLITRESIKSTRENFTYSNQKSIVELSMVYRKLAETLDTCCEYYQSAYSTNK